MSVPSVLWFRRDLRLADHPALAASGHDVVGLFVIDPSLIGEVGPSRAQYLAATLESLNASIGGRLVVRVGDPVAIVPQVAREAGAATVYATMEYTPRGRDRDDRVANRLSADGRSWCAVGSPYVVEPATTYGASGQPYRVFSGFRRAWLSRLGEPPISLGEVNWVALDGVGASALVAEAGRRRPHFFGDLPDGPSLHLPGAGEPAAAVALERFASRLERYDVERDRPDLDATSRLSAFLRFGVLHPRTVLARLDGPSAAAAKLRDELCWREFYADVLAHHPSSAWRAFRPSMASVRVDRGPRAEERFRTWARGETGFPVVDAGMRQLLAEGWMHNRVRMNTASFLVKHLHLDWRWGAKWFLWRLVDGDLASNQHGWQWVAGTGTDAAPFFRIFNPTRQAERFDPHGDYVRRYVAELADVAVPHCLRPGAAPMSGYPAPMIDLANERTEALARYAAAVHPSPT